MKITFTDPYSDEATSSVSDTFKVIIMDKCSINELTLTESLGVLLQYTTDGTSSAYQLNHASTQPANTWPDCTLTYTFELYDETTQLWTVWDGTTYPFAAWTPGSTTSPSGAGTHDPGSFTLQTNDYQNYDNYSVLARVTAEDLHSEVEGKNSITD